MFRCQLGRMIVLVAFHAEVCIFCDAVKLGRLWRYFGTILAHRGFRLLFLEGVYNVVDDVDGEDLIIFKDHILVLKDLRVLFLVVKVNRFKSLRARDRLVDELVLTVAIRLAHRHLIHYAAYLLLCVFYSVEPHVEDHTSLREFVALLAHLKQLVSVVQLLSRQERFENDAAFGVAAES